MVSNYCILILKAGSRSACFDIAFVKSKPGPFVVPFNVSFVGGVQMCCLVCVCVFIRESEVKVFLSTSSISFSFPAYRSWVFKRWPSVSDLHAGRLLSHKQLTTVTLMCTLFLYTMCSVKGGNIWSKVYTEAIGPNRDLVVSQPSPHTGVRISIHKISVV